MNYRAFLLTAVIGLLCAYATESVIVAASNDFTDPVVITAELPSGEIAAEPTRRNSDEGNEPRTKRLEDVAPPAFKDSGSAGVSLVPDVISGASLTPEQWAALIEVAKLVIPLFVGFFGGNGKLGGLLLSVLTFLSGKLEGSSPTKVKK